MIQLDIYWVNHKSIQIVVLINGWCVLWRGRKNISWKTIKEPIGWLEKKVYNKSVYKINI